MPQYQGIWTLAQAAQLQSTQRWATDPLFENTTLLLQADNAANGAQNNTFLDSSSNNFTITRNGNTTQGSFTPFSQSPGWWGNYFDGTGDYLTAPSNVAFALGTGDFTIENWFFMTTSTDSALWGIGDGTTSGGVMFRYEPASTRFNFYNATDILFTGSAVTLNNWHHIAVVRSSGTLRVYLNGSQYGSGVSNSTNIAQNIFYIGGGKIGATVPYNPYYGYISNLRVVKGTALYTSNFTPSAIPLTAITNTSLLTCQSNRFVDNSTNNFTITSNGDTSVQAFSPFAPQYQYTPTVTGGSGYFDGNGDYLTGNAVLVTTTTANTFSIEGWFYPTSFANLIWLVGDMDATGGTNNVAVDVSTGGAIELYWWDGAAKRCTSTTVMRVNQWNYFAIVVNAGAISIYVNSTTAGQSGTTTLTNRSAASQNFSVGQFNNSTTPNGYIGSLRWSTSARTISSIPTAPYTSDANTRLLLNFTNAGITDGTLKNNLETVGNAQVSTSVVKYGTGSMYFDGSGDYLTSYNAGGLFRLGTIYTVEMWFYTTTVAANNAGLINFATTISGNTGFNLYRSSAEILCNDGATGGTGPSSGVGSVVANVWTHLAVVSNGVTTKVYLDGVERGSYTGTTGSANSMTYVTIGSFNDKTANFTGYIDDLRITRGIARYTANFIPPSVALPRQ